MVGGLLDEVLHTRFKLGRTGRYVLDFNTLGVGRQRLAGVLNRVGILRRGGVQDGDVAVFTLVAAVAVVLGHLVVAIATIVVTIATVATIMATVVATIMTISDDLDNTQARDCLLYTSDAADE